MQHNQVQICAKKGISVYLYIMIRGFAKNSSRMQMSVRLLLFLV